MNEPVEPDHRSAKAKRNEESFVAPCREIPLNAAFRWLKLGWQDVRAAPVQSLSYGFIMVLVSYAITGFAYALGNMGLYLGLLTGFVFLGPILAISLYSISARLERGKTVSLLLTFEDAKRQLSNTIVYTVALGILFLVWARAAAMVHIFFPQQEPVHWLDFWLFLAIGSSIGAIFCTVIFTISAFSLPMLLDRDVDAISAVVTSTNAVLRNKIPCFVWAISILCLLSLGVATFYLGFMIVLPWVGHATWHAYRETILSDAITQRELAE